MGQPLPIGVLVGGGYTGVRCMQVFGRGGRRVEEGIAGSKGSDGVGVVALGG